MNNKIYKTIASLALSGVLVSGAEGCTDKFEDFNTDPNAPTPEQMEGDYTSTATLLATMVPVCVLGQENDYQMIDQMIGCEYGRMTAAKNQWGSNLYYATYNPPTGWTGNTFDTLMPKIYTSFFQVYNISGSENLMYYWCDLIRIIGTLRISDTYGPTPFSLIDIAGGKYTTAYDNMPELYDAMFEELDLVIAGMKQSLGSPTASALFGPYDYIYGGDLTKWVKMANTVKLRMALRLVNVKPELAKQKGEEAVADPIGLIENPADAAWSTYIPGGNALWKTSQSWAEGRVSADITSYMNGYNDPRISNYCKPDKNGNFTGARSGVYHYDLTTFLDYSAPNYDQQSPLLCMSASESWFARAEGALRGWNVGGTAKDLYEMGVTVSMQERGVSLGGYLESEATPANYVALDNTAYSISAASTICPKYDESASFETNLERIMVQKWLGNYPNGWETWTDVRRTGYPKFFPVVNNMSTDGVSTARGMRRLPFPNSEFNTNESNVKAAQAMLGGPDTGATDLWWAKRN